MGVVSDHRLPLIVDYGLASSVIVEEIVDEVAVEVKATNGNAKSLKEVINNKNKYGVDSALKLIDGNIGYSNGIYTIPLYMAFLID